MLRLIDQLYTVSDAVASLSMFDGRDGDEILGIVAFINKSIQPIFAGLRVVGINGKSKLQISTVTIVDQKIIVNGQVDGTPFTKNYALQGSQIVEVK